MQLRVGLINVVQTVAALLAAVAVGATTCTACARRSWLVDLMTHFRVQYAVVAVLCTVVLAWTFQPGWAALAAAACALNVMASIPLLRRAPVAASPGSASSVAIRVATINVFYRNHDCSRTVGFVRSERPDVIALEEVSPRWQSELSVLADQYPFRYFTGDALSRGVLLLSCWPIERAASLALRSNASHGVLATVRVRGQALQVVGVHTCWPMGRAKAALRNRQLAQLAELAQSESGRLIVLGDLNVSPFSPHFQTLLETGRLASAAQGFGWQPTWPSVLPPVGIQIDHVLVSRGIEVRRFARGPFIGSDHWPVVADLSFR
ncbi:MAG: endonuclease/exonuclease/phosphatase family protein [Steroidobacteraceae bacterium]